LRGVSHIVSTTRKRKVMEEARAHGFYDKLNAKEIETFEQNNLQILIDGEYNVISEIPYTAFLAETMDCSDLNFSNINNFDVEKSLTRFANRFINEYLDSAIVLKKISVPTKINTSSCMLTYETNKGVYSIKSKDVYDNCETIFPALIEICEKENTKYKVHVNKVFRRCAFFITDRQAAYLNQKYKLDLVKKY
jgi:hypothetical protein